MVRIQGGVDPFLTSDRHYEPETGASHLHPRLSRYLIRVLVVGIG